MPRMKTETFGTGDQSWLGSAHGIGNCKTRQLNVAAFAGLFPNGYIPSGTPVALVAGLLVPYDSTEATTTNAGVLDGHLFTDQSCATGMSNFAVPVLDHGRVRTSKVPAGANAFTAPVAAAKRANVTVVYN